MIDTSPPEEFHTMIFYLDELTINVPRAKPKPIVSVLIDPFDKYVWITYLMLVLTMTVTISQFGEILGRCRFVEIVLELVMTCLAGPSRTYGGTFENRLLTMFCLMDIVLISSYQSLIISFMSIVRYGSEINTLEEIREQSVNVPRAKPKPIVSVLIDPFDKYVWITYLMLVLTMAVTISQFGEILVCTEANPNEPV
uniref:Uncharacterized protein n=1 Tax=Anopheles coluzzii TaxID=1518534 RepID=A0A8W7PYK0_ANOCL